METELYIPGVIKRDTPPVVAPTVITPRQISSTGETVFLEDMGVTVTNARFMVGSQTFSMRNITSIRAVEVIPSKTGAVLVGIIGFLMCTIAFAIFGADGRPSSDFWGLLVLGAVAVLAALLNVKSKRSTYRVMITSASGEICAYESPSSLVIARITEALNDVIAYR